MTMIKLKIILFYIIKFKPLNIFLLVIAKPLIKILPEKFQRAIKRLPVNMNFRLKIDSKHHFKMFSDGYDAIAKRVYWGGICSYESNTMGIFRLLAESSSVFFDIGANTGIYSIYAASVNAGLEVHAFEPINVVFKYLAKNKELNSFDRIYINNIALSDKEGKLQFFIPFDNLKQIPLGASIFSGHMKNMNIFTNYVNASTLDIYCKERKIEKIDLIKVDAEGMENLVFEGGNNILSKSKPIIISEVLPGANEESVQAILDKLGYIYMVLTDKGLKRENKIKGIMIGDNFNHLFIQKHHIEHLIKNSINIY